MALYSRVKSWVTSEVLTASDLNAEFNNILTNSISDSIVGTSGNVSAMQATIDPGTVGGESLPSNVTGELQRLRFAINRIVGGAQWYSSPLRNLTTLITTSDIADSSITSSKLTSSIVLPPTGVIMPYGGTSAPSNYLLCDGTSYLRTDYPALFTVIGTAFGTADGTHFNVPDLRGRFLRGYDGVAGRDPDKASRTAMATGGATGNAIGSVQADQIVSHNHTYDTYLNASSVQSGTGQPNSLHETHNISTGSTGGNETRPINAYVNYIIKAV